MDRRRGIERENNIEARHKHNAKEWHHEEGPLGRRLFNIWQCDVTTKERRRRNSQLTSLLMLEAWLEKEHEVGQALMPQPDEFANPKVFKACWKEWRATENFIQEGEDSFEPLRSDQFQQENKLRHNLEHHFTALA